MNDVSRDLSRAVFIKSPFGQQEIQTRQCGLNPVQRQLLVLINGKRSVAELSTLIAGHNIEKLLDHLKAKGCIDSLAPTQSTDMTGPEMPPSTSQTAIDAVEAELGNLPEATSRSAEERDKARSFMVNTVNYIFGQNTRMVMLDRIFECKTVQDLRLVYPQWVKIMLSSRDGTKELPKLRKDLLKVL
jgi:hypothetical protein